MKNKILNRWSSSLPRGNGIKRWVVLCLCLAFFLPTSAQAARVVENRMDVRSSLMQPAAEGVEFKTAYENGLYAVYARPNVTPDGPGYTYTAQVTVKVPHGTGDARVEVTNLQTGVAGLIWGQLSRVDAPSEDPASDYISFELNPTLSQLDAIQWQAGVAVKLFTFADANGASDVVGLMANCDHFATPNSAGTNPGNQIAIQGIDIDNAYIGNYDVTVDHSVCGDEIFLPLVTRE